MGRWTTLLVAMTITASLGAGCIGQGADDGSPEPAGAGDADAGATHTHALNFTGTLMVPNPTYPDPTGAGIVPDVGQEGQSYSVHVVTLNATADAIKLVLTWDSQNTPAAAVPDLDLFVTGPDGSDLSGATGASAGPSETVEIKGPLAAGDYTVRVNLFAGVQVSYALDVTVTESDHDATAAA